MWVISGGGGRPRSKQIRIAFQALLGRPYYTGLGPVYDKPIERYGLISGSGPLCPRRGPLNPDSPEAYQP